MFLKRVGQNVDKVFNTLLSLLFFSVIYLYQIKKILTRSKVCRFCCCMLSVGISKRHFLFLEISYGTERCLEILHTKVCAAEKYMSVKKHQQFLHLLQNCVLVVINSFQIFISTTQWHFFKHVIILFFYFIYTTEIFYKIYNSSSCIGCRTF